MLDKIKTLQEEAKQYDRLALIELQNKRRANIALFEDSIRNERILSQQEEIAEEALESKLNLHNLRKIILNKSEYDFIVQDLPLLKLTREKRQQTITLLKQAIIEEQEAMDREEIMIRYLESYDSQK